MEMTNWVSKTPICVTMFNRPDLVQQVFNVTRQVKPPKLLVIGDAPRLNKLGEAEKCAETRLILNQVDWECEVLTNFSDINMGPRNRIASGLKWVFSIVEEAIILEHDCLPSLSFFQFCEEMLERYRNDERITMISGNNFQLGGNQTGYSYYFSRYNHIWGWASWRRAFQHYDETMKEWEKLRDSHFLNQVFEDTNAVNYWTNQFEQTYRGLIQTWDYQFTLGMWARKGLAILPSVNLVTNIGFGEGATHTSNPNLWFANLPVEEMQFPLKHPPKIERNVAADNFSEKTIASGLVTGEWLPLVFERLLRQSEYYLNNNLNEQALNSIEKAIILQPNIPDLHYGKAIALARLGYSGEAVETLYETLNLDPQHLGAKQLLNELRNLEMATEQMVSYSKKEIISPLTGSSNVTLETELQVDFLIEIYKPFGIDVTKYFKTYTSIQIYKCCDTGYQFYYPFDISGDEEFYEKLQNFPWYYMSDKWEHQVAIQQINSKDKVLEIGCGYGAFLEKINHKNASAVGLEFNLKAVNIAKNKGLTIYKQSIQEHMLQNYEKYDVVCTFQVLEHIHNVREFIQSMIHCTRKGGKIIISVPNNDAFILKCDSIQTLNRPPHHVGLWNLNSLISLTKLFNLKIDSVALEPLQHYHLDYVLSITKNKIVQEYGQNGYSWIKNHDTIVSNVSKLLLNEMEGHSILVCFLKI